jgi:hypothetical protein
VRGKDMVIERRLGIYDFWTLVPVLLEIPER